jgi:hypothetical protein
MYIVVVILLAVKLQARSPPYGWYSVRFNLTALFKLLRRAAVDYASCRTQSALCLCFASINLCSVTPSELTGLYSVVVLLHRFVSLRVSSVICRRSEP